MGEAINRVKTALYRIAELEDEKEHLLGLIEEARDCIDPHVETVLWDKLTKALEPNYEPGEH
jgi:hypothetical protein